MRGIVTTTLADKIRMHGREKYAVPARQRKEKRFSIKAGDIVHELKIGGYAAAVCSALKTREFLRDNDLRLVDRRGPPSGQSTTVTYTYEFVEAHEPSRPTDDSWMRLRGALKEIFAELRGGEAYLQDERRDFYRSKEGK